MDQLLLPYLHASNDLEREQHLEKLLLVHASSVVRQVLRRKLGFYVNPLGINPHNQDAEDLYQEIITKVVQTLQDLREATSKATIENLQQYVSRIASNACNDVLRAKSPARARLKNNLRFVLTNHRDLAMWKREGKMLAGLSVWEKSAKSLSTERHLVDVDGSFRAKRFPGVNIQQVPLTKVVAELLEWIDGPLELEVLVTVIAALLDIKDHPSVPVDDETNAYLEARLAEGTLSSSSRLEEQALLRSLWQALKELAKEQRDVFCFGFEDDSGRDLFTVLLEAEIVNLGDLAQELCCAPETIVGLWSKMPMDDNAIAAELKTSRAQVQKWRFRALGRLRKGLLPFGGRK